MKLTMFTDKKPIPNPQEAIDNKYLSLSAIKNDLKNNPQKYTPWFKLIMKKLTSSDILTS